MLAPIHIPTSSVGAFLFVPRTCFFCLFVYFTGLITEFYFHSFSVAVFGFLRLLSGVFPSRLVTFYSHCTCCVISYLKWPPSASIQYLKTVELRGASYSLAGISWCSEAYSIDNGRTLSLLHQFLFAAFSLVSLPFQCLTSVSSSWFARGFPSFSTKSSMIWEIPQFSSVQFSSSVVSDSLRNLRIEKSLSCSQIGDIWSSQLLACVIAKA